MFGSYVVLANVYIFASSAYKFSFCNRVAYVRGKRRITARDPIKSKDKA